MCVMRNDMYYAESRISSRNFTRRATLAATPCSLWIFQSLIVQTDCAEVKRIIRQALIG